MNEDKLLKVALELYYRDRPEVMQRAWAIVDDYCNKEQTTSTYEAALKDLHELMNDLVPNILLYFLTTIPLPKHNDKGSSTFSDLMKRSKASLLDNMEDVLKDFIENLKREDATPSKGSAPEPEKPPGSLKAKRKNAEDVEQPSPKKTLAAKSAKNEKKVCPKLLELCVNYVLANANTLRQLYNRKNKTAWQAVASNSCEETQVRCYKYIENLNLMLKWLRMVESGQVTLEAVAELYGDSRIFLLERNLHSFTDDSVFNVSDELKAAIYNCICGWKAQCHI